MSHHGNDNEAPKSEFIRQILEAERKSTGETLAVAQQPVAWQPIETAPKDGTFVLVYAQEWTCAGLQPLPAFQAIAAYHSDAGWCVDELREVTHWMPLPPPPHDNL